MENAELYSSANGMQKKDAEEILAEFRDKMKWKTGGRILDVGCGSGEVTTKIILPRLPKDFTEMIGLDVSPGMVRHARTIHSHSKVKFIQFDIARNSDDILREITKTIKTSEKGGGSNLEEIKFEDQKTKISVTGSKIIGDHQGIRVESKSGSGFDNLFSFYCLHWVPDQKLAFRNMFELLKPGGEALLAFLVKSPIFTLYKELSKTSLWKEYMQDVDSFIPFYQDSDSPMENFIEIVKSEGFLVLSSDCREKNYSFESFSSLRNAITAVNPFLSRIPNALQEDFINDCLYHSEILNLATPKNSHYRVCYKLMVAHIRKPET